MTRNILFVALFSLSLSQAAPPAQAQTCGALTIELVSDPSLQGLMYSPAMYVGNIDSGSLAPGSWNITFNDADWPASGNARRSHIKSMYTYDAQAQTFTATFSSDDVAFDLVGSGGVSLSGVASVTLVAVDLNGNGKLANNELDQQTMTTTMASGCQSSSCGGTGELSGGASLATLTTPLTGDLDTSLCVTAVDEVPWRTVKRLYR